MVVSSLKITGRSPSLQLQIATPGFLIQINAAKSALHKAGQMVLEGHMRCCVREGIQHGDADETIKQFAKAIERFSNI